MSGHAPVPRMIGIDFDGTVADFAYPDIGAPKAGVKEALTLFRELGFHVIIYSCRTCKWFPEIFAAPGEVLDMNRKCVKDMIEFLDKHGIPYDSVDDGTKGKPMCDYYIDDKGIHFQDNWAEIAESIRWATVTQGVKLFSRTGVVIER